MDNNTKTDQTGSEKDKALNLEDVSINTMKSDIAKAEGKDGGWFDFLSKHKENKTGQPLSKKEDEEKKEIVFETKPDNLPISDPANSETKIVEEDAGVKEIENSDVTLKDELQGNINELSKVLTQNKTIEDTNLDNPLPTGSLEEKIKAVEGINSENPSEETENDDSQNSTEDSLNNELEAFKKEIEKENSDEKPSEIIPENLPVVENATIPSLSSFFPSKNAEEKPTVLEAENQKESTNKLAEALNKNINENYLEKSEAELVDEKGEKKEKSIIEFKGNLEPDKKESSNQESAPLDSFLKGGSIGNDMEEPEKKQEKSDESPLPLELKKFTLEDEDKAEKEQKVNTISPFRGDGLAGTVVNASEENPFSAHLDPREREGSSLLQKVESAINYSASPDFAKEREAGEKLTQEIKEGTKVVDLKGKSVVADSSSNKKKYIFIGVGVFGIIFVFIVLFLIFGAGKSSNSPIADNKNLNTNANGNINTNANKVVKPIPINDNVDTTPKIAIQKVILNVESKVVNSPQELTKVVESYKSGTAVSKLTQIVFAKSNGSSLSLADLDLDLGIKIPIKIIPNPETVPALFFVDYFNKGNVFGLIIPTENRDETLFSAMSDWEPTMVSDLKPLWDGYTIDNQNGYFANSKLFTNSRYALIDKKTGMSLDYVINGGNIFITFGRYSMQALNKEFIGVNKTVNSGIKWEASSGSDSTSSSDGANIGSNSNLNGSDDVNKNANTNNGN